MDNHPGLHPDITLRQSERDGGIWLKDVPIGAYIIVQTMNTKYRIERRAEKDWWISGHERFCPAPTKCTINGSTWGGSMLKVEFIGIGMHLEFAVPQFPLLTTTMIRSAEIRKADGALMNTEEDDTAKLSS